MKRQRVEAQPQSKEFLPPRLPHQHQPAVTPQTSLEVIQNHQLPSSERHHHAHQLAQHIGNQRFGKLMRQLDVQRGPSDDDKAPKRELSLFNILLNPTTREETALNRMLQYANQHPQGPIVGMPDSDFQTRVYKSAGELLSQMQQHESFEKMPARLKAIVFALEQLNYDKVLDPQDEEWMTSREGSPGTRNESRAGSTSAFGPAAWKCNKFVADAYASTEGAGLRKKFPLKEGGGIWGPQANDFASGSTLKNFPVKELSKLKDDGKSIAEVLEYNDRGKVIAKYVVDGPVFKKYEKIKGKWEETGETRNPEDLQPGHSASIGDIVAFKNVVRGASGHTGLNLGNDLFISAMNSTEGVGIASIQDHIDPDAWDKYSQVTFRQYGN